MAADTSALFSELNRCLIASQFTKAVTLCDKILAESPDDKDALHCKAACFMDQGQFDMALKLLESQKDLALHRAYCLFRLFRIDEALSLLDSIEPSTPATELKAQALYRGGRYEEAVPLYESLLNVCEDEYRSERLSNYLAACAAAAYNVPQSFICPQLANTTVTDTYEQQYNKACMLLAAGEVEQAKTLLALAEDTCRKMLETDEDITEEEMESELVLLRLQSAVAMQLLGDDQAALAVYSKFLSQKSSDIGLVAVASNNVIAIHKEDKLFDSKKKLKAFSAEGIETKLTSKQRACIDVNHALLLLFMGHKDACRRKCEDIAAADPDSDIPVLIKACSLKRDKKHNQSVDVLKAFTAAHKSNCERVQLAIAQSHVSQNNLDEALKVIRSLPLLQHRPAMVAFQVAIAEQQGDISTCVKLFDESVAFWTSSSEPDARENLLGLLKASGKFKLDHKDQKGAAACFKRVLDTNSDDPAALAMLISALSTFDLAEAEKYVSSLPPLEFGDGQELDVDALEKSTTLQAASRSTGSALSSIPVAAPAKPKRKRKKRPGKLPKNYDPEIKPNPERWLPRWERKSTSSKRKKRHLANMQAVGRGTQGSSSASANVTQSPTAKSPEKPLPTASELEAASKNRKNKKKKKGRGK